MRLGKRSLYWAGLILMLAGLTLAAQAAVSHEDVLRIKSLADRGELLSAADLAIAEQINATTSSRIDINEALTRAKARAAGVAERPRPPRNPLDEYIWTPTTYAWVDIAGDGTNANVTGDDQNVGPFPIGFSFPYYGNTYTDIRICSNGWVSFTSTSTVYFNTAIPAAAEPNNVLYPFWDDLYPPSGGHQVMYRTDANPQRFIISYINIAHIQSSTARYTFQVILYPNGNIVYQYNSISTVAPTNTSCTVGLENATGTEGVQVCFDGTGTLPTNGSAFLLGQPNGVPNPVTNLAASVAGNNVTLTWVDPTQDTNGNAMTVDSVVTYIGTTRLGRVNAGVQTYTHTGAPQGNHTYRVIAFNDGYQSRPTTVGAVVGNPTYQEGFETTGGMWTPTPPTGGWEWGAPTGPGGPAPHGGANVWGTVLGGNYIDNACWNLDLNLGLVVESPTATVEFWAWYSTETSFDGCHFKASLDGGTTWELVTPQGGYPQPSIFSNTCIGTNVPSWAGNSNGWIYVVMPIGQYQGQAPLFRFVFGTDPSVNSYPGFFFDDMIIWGLAVPQGAAVSGTVTLDGGTGNVVQAAVRANGIGNPVANPNAAGAYSLANVQVGNRVLTATLNGYNTINRPVTVPAGGLTNENFTLRRMDPPAPTGLTATVNTGTGLVTLDWADSPDPLVDAYRVYRKLREDNNWNLVAVFGPSQGTNQLPSPGIYQFRVTAIDTHVIAPPVESPPSNSAEVLYGELPPTRLSANGSFDDRIRLRWLAPGVNVPPIQIFYDDSTSEVWYRVATPNGPTDYFAVRFTPPSADSVSYPLPVQSVNIYMERNDLLPNVWICPGTPTAPNMPNAYMNWTNIGANGTPGWLIAPADGNIMLPDASDFWVVWQFPPGLTGPGTGSDASAPDQRSYWSQGTTWNQWLSHDWMARVWVGSPQGRFTALTVGNPSGYPASDVPSSAILDVSLLNKALASGRPFDARDLVSCTDWSGVVTRAIEAPFSRAPVIELVERDGRNPLDEVLYYKVYRNGDSIGTSPFGTESFTNFVNEGIDYNYFVTAFYDNLVESGPTSTITARAAMAPGAPQNVTGLSLNATQIRITWTDPTVNADGTNCVDLANLRLYRDGVLIGTVAPGVGQYVDTPPQPNRTYMWGVRGIDEVPNEGPAGTYTGSVVLPWMEAGYDWVDIAGVGTPVTLSDDVNVGPFPLGFNFTYYGNTYNQIRVCSNGFISFTSTSNSLGNVCIPNAAEPNNAIFMFWDDLNPGAGGQVYRYEDVANQRWILSFINVPHFGNPAPETFQVILGANGSITLQYLLVSAPASVTIGIENTNGTAGFDLWCNGVGVWTPVSESAVSFFGDPPVYTTVSGTVTLDGGAGVVTSAVVRANGVSRPQINPAANGTYTLADVQVGNRILTAELAGYHTVNRPRTVPLEGLTNENFSLRRLNPPVPANLTATQTAGLATLNWDDSPDALVDSYRVYRKLRADQNWALRQTVRLSQTTDQLPVDGIYQYRVTAVDYGVTPPAVESDPSTVAEVLYGSLPPQMLSANGNYDDRIRLSWLAPGVNNPPRQIFYDDSTSEQWYRVATPNGPTDYFAVRFTPPPVDSVSYPLPVQSVNIYMERNDPLPNVWICPGSPTAPNIAGAFMNWTNVGANGSPGWLVAPTNGNVLLQNATDFWVVWQFPPGLTGPGTGSDASAPDLRSYWSQGTTWNQWNSHDWMARVWVGAAQGGLALTAGSPGGYASEDIPSVAILDEISEVKGQAGKSVGPLRISKAELNSPVQNRTNATAKPEGKVTNHAGLDVVEQWSQSELVPVSSSRDGGRNSLDQLTGYRIYRGGTQIGTVGPTVTQYFDLNRVENTDYSYYVRATYDDGPESQPSNTVTARCNMAPGRPGGMSLTPVGTSQMRIMWTDPTQNDDGTNCVDLAGVRVFRNGALLGTVNPGVGQYLDTPPQNNVFYLWEVRAFDEVPNVGPAANMRGAVQSPWRSVAYEWIDISGNGTNTGISGDDQNAGPFNLGFTVEFYGNTYNSIRVCSNGWLSFTSTSTAYTNGAIPSAAEPNNALYPFWDDLYPPSGGQILYRSDVANGQFIVSFINVPHISSPSELYTFQVVIDDGGGIRFAYHTIPTGQMGNTSCTVGVENATGTEALQLYNNSAGDFPPASNTAVEFWGGPSGRITGTVRSFGNNLPIQGVAVYAQGMPDTSYSDASGTYDLAIEPGTYTVHFYHQHYCSQSVAGVVVEDRQQTVRNAVLRAPAAQISVTSLTFVVPQNQSRQETFTISNNGGQCPLTFRLSEGVDWLTVSPDTGSVATNGAVEITVTAAPGNRPVGDLQTDLICVYNAVGTPSQIRVDLRVLTVEDPTIVPTEFAFHGNYPNPFNPTTTLVFDVPKESRVQLAVFNVMGQEVARVADDVFTVGRHHVMFDAGELPSGMYLVSMEAGEFRAMGKLLLLK